MFNVLVIAMFETMLTYNCIQSVFKCIKSVSAAWITVLLLQVCLISACTVWQIKFFCSFASYCIYVLRWITQFLGLLKLAGILFWNFSLFLLFIVFNSPFHCTWVKLYSILTWQVKWMGKNVRFVSQSLFRFKAEILLLANFIRLTVLHVFNYFFYKKWEKIEFLIEKLTNGF